MSAAESKVYSSPTTPKATARPAGKQAYTPKPSFKLNQFLSGLDSLHVPETEPTWHRCQPDCKHPATRCGDTTRTFKCHHQLLGSWDNCISGKVRKAVLHHSVARKQARDHTFTDAATGAEIAAYEDWKEKSKLICEKHNTARENSFSCLAHRLRLLNQSDDPKVLQHKRGAASRDARRKKLLAHRAASASK